MKKLLAIFAVFCLVSSAAIAKPCCKKCDMKKPAMVEMYAHPTMFSQEAQEVATADATYIVGGKINKTHNQFGFKNKDKVFVSSWAKDVLGLLKANRPGDWNPKMPVLRSEFAVFLSEGFNLTDGRITKSYADITSNYWAKLWIYRALNGGVMIGYPCGNFKPDQPITKAEVFATIATMIDVPTNGSNVAPKFKNSEIKYIPDWAVRATQEVVNSQLLEEVPNPNRVINDKYLSKEQVAFLVGALRMNFAANGKLLKDANAPCGIQQYNPVALNIKLTERVSARHSNVGDKFNAKTTNAVTVQGISFPAGSVVTGKVVEVARPGIGKDNRGYVKVKFLTLKNGKDKVCFPKQLSEAKANTLKNPNIIARLLGSPFSMAGRVVGVVGRTGASSVNVCADGIEQYGDQLSNSVVNTCTLHPGSGLKSFGNSFVTVGKGVVRVCELTVSGTVGVLYEVGDELLYVILPSYSNASSLNPNEELTIIF